MTDATALARGVVRCEYCRTPFVIEHRHGNRHIFHPIEQAAEAADREAAGVNESPASRPVADGAGSSAAALAAGEVGE